MAFSDDELAFIVRTPDREYRIYASGKVEGFGYQDVKVVNHIPRLVHELSERPAEEPTIRSMLKKFVDDSKSRIENNERIFTEVDKIFGEPDIDAPEEIKDLLSGYAKCDPAWKEADNNLIEAYRRGQRSSATNTNK